MKQDNDGKDHHKKFDSERTMGGLLSLTAVLPFIALAMLLVSVAPAYGLVGGQLQIGASNKVKISSQNPRLSAMKDKDYRVKYYKLGLYVNPPIPTPFFDIGLGVGGSYEDYDLSSEEYKGFKPLSFGSCTGTLCINRHLIDRFLTGVQSFQLTEDQESETLSGTLNSLKGFYLGPQIMVSATIPGISAGPTVRGQYAFAKLNLNGTVNMGDDKENVKIPVVGRGLRYAAGFHFSPLPLMSFFVEHEWTKDTVGLSETLKALASQAAARLTDEVGVEDFDLKVSTRGWIFGVRVGL